ncbi:MAG: toprim domain-containing protein [Myxococcales bacterium]
MAKCPAHEDGQASLSVCEGEDGRVLIKCHAGCDVRAVCAALGLEMRDLFPLREQRPVKKRLPFMNGAVLWEKLAEHDEAGEAYLRSRKLDGALALGLVRFNVPSRAIANDTDRWLSKRAEEGYRVAVAQRDATGKVRDFQMRAVGPADPSKLSLCGSPRPACVAFGRPDLAAKGGSIFIAEGMADTLSLCVAGGVAIGAGGTGRLKQLAELVPEGAEAVLCVQNDKEQQSARAFLHLAAALEARGVRILWLTTPPPHKDPADWLKAIGLAGFQRALASEAVGPRNPPTVDGARARPDFVVHSGEGHQAVAAAVSALARHPTTFQRSNVLVTVVDWKQPSSGTVIRESGTPVVREVPAAMLWERLSALVRWLKPDSEGLLYPCDPPHSVLQAVACRGEWEGIRPLNGLVAAPVLRPDGSVLDQPGYDAATGLLFVPSGPCHPIPASPTREEALAARDALLEVVCDFPFAEPAHQSAWLAALLTPFARPAIGDKNAPLFLVDGNTRGCGKSRLVDCISLIATGRTAPRQQFTTNSEELDKRVVSHLQAADALVLFDNVVGDFGGAVLDKLLTAEGWYASRLLGKNDASASLKLRNNTTWYATANNATLAGDVVRRAVHIRLATTLEHPEERSGFRHPDLLGWVHEERPRLLAAALTVLRGWFAAGKPWSEMAVFGSFEAWSSIVRNVCLWLNLADPWAGTRQGLRESDPGDSLHATLLLGLADMDPERKGLTTGEIKRRLEADLSDARSHERAPRFAVFLDGLAAVGNLVEDGKVNAQRLGRRLQLLKDKRRNGAWIEVARDSGGNVSRWVVANESGHAGAPTVPPAAFAPPPRGVGYREVVL